VVPGLNDFEGKHPPVAPVFWSFRVMVGVGMLMLAVSWLASWQLWRRGEPSRLVGLALVGMTFSGWVATVAGWYVTEIGRQPWLVYGVLTTHEAASDVPAMMIATTFAGYMAVYVFLLGAYVGTLYYLAGQGRRAR
jgi:cytochrome d ubiquinol oxidase subunit I